MLTVKLYAINIALILLAIIAGVLAIPGTIAVLVLEPFINYLSAKEQRIFDAYEKQEND